MIIPVYKPDASILSLFQKIREQTHPVNKIIVMETRDEGIEKGSPYLEEAAEKYSNIQVIPVQKKLFDHGNTRRQAVLYSEAEYFVMMTQDAIPVDNLLIESLLSHLEFGEAVIAYARQLPKENCGITERYTRGFNYPETSRRKTEKDLENLGIKTFFCSNVCAAYNRSIYDEQGGFVTKTIFNEDMIYAAGVIRHGYAVYYDANALVYHSHNYTGKEQLHRNFDLGVSQAEYPQVFCDVPSEGEGIKMVKKTLKYLREQNFNKEIFPYIYQSGCKYLGYLLGKNYKKLPHGLVLRLSMNPDYFM